MKRPRDAAARTTLAAAVLAAGLTGCSILSPSVITEPYPASDGTNVELPGTGVALRNVIVIGSGKGEPATMVGSITNGGTQEIRVLLQAELGETAQPTQTTITVGPRDSVRLGPDQQNAVDIPELPVEPGATMQISAGTANGGRADFRVPVLPPQGDYAGITPSPSATPSPSPTGSPGDAGADPTDLPDPENSAATPTEVDN